MKRAITGCMSIIERPWNLIHAVQLYRANDLNLKETLKQQTTDDTYVVVENN